MLLGGGGGAHHRGVRVRQAVPTDAESIEALYRDLVPGDNNIHVSPQRIADLESDCHNRLLVIEVDQEVCGTAFLTICLDPMYSLHPYGVVENVAVSPAQRGRGVGRPLMAAIEDEARGAKGTKLMLLSAASRAEAHEFFNRMGFDGVKKRAFVKYLNRTEPLRSSG